MRDFFDTFPPTVDAATERLAAFAPHAGKPYQQNRNYDLGPGKHLHVSTLSPYLRMKVLDEADVSRAVLSHMSESAAEKFLMELWWRTYWKGWMEQRPAVWARYLDDLQRLHNEVQTQSGMRNRWAAACTGDTGIAPFDHWAQELAATGYLHNHARMWFASIWIFTLKLPWQLGADFFLRHLLDGDAAVNTLQWRWVAGIQTQGKTYLARPDNIAQFTVGRFEDVTGLAAVAPAVQAPKPPERQPIPKLASYAGAPGDRVGLLLHSDDLGAPFLGPLGIDPVAVAYVDATDAQSPWSVAPFVTDFRTRLARDAWPGAEVLDSPDNLAAWASRNALDHIVTPHAPVGAVRTMLRKFRKDDAVTDISEIRREIDTTAWPLATAGFFKFKANIPDLITQFVR